MEGVSKTILSSQQSQLSACPPCLLHNTSSTTSIKKKHVSKYNLAAHAPVRVATSDTAQGAMRHTLKINPKLGHAQLCLWCSFMPSIVSHQSWLAMAARTELRFRLLAFDPQRNYETQPASPQVRWTGLLSSDAPKYDGGNLTGLAAKIAQQASSCWQWLAQE